MEGLHQKQKCLKRNLLKERAELKRKSLIEERRDCLKEKGFTKRTRVGLNVKTCL